MRLSLPFAFTTAAFIGIAAAQAPAAAKIHAQIKQQPAIIHWCLPQAGDDPAHIISKSCEAYSECLGAVGLDESIDTPPFSGLSNSQVAWVQKCHQRLYNAALPNPQIKGSKATQDWLERGVYQGTEARPFPAPASQPPTQ